MSLLYSNELFGFCFVLLWSNESFLYVLDKRSLSDLFLESVACFFILRRSFTEQNFNFNEVQVIDCFSFGVKSVFDYPLIMKILSYIIKPLALNGVASLVSWPAKHNVLV